MPPLRSSSSSLARASRRRWAWPILIIAVAIPVAFISGRLENQRGEVAAQFGQNVALWDGNPEVPDWLRDSVGHEILIRELTRRLSKRPRGATDYTVEAAPEPGGDGSHWRVRLIWEDAPSVDLVLAFDGLGVDPRLITVGAGPKPDALSAGGAGPESPGPGSELR
ncbi:MAG: hypothetical protein VXY94_12735 [Planctomycetota bacterium]|nr:hypothetical protein [Planctomycetota bacterium]MEC8560929.1 hypothetical protein [Planctomycetota bacterium]MEC9157539.1 hypothetical protein [Planctomycetota bacterium]MED5508279.1 hypothetical protein [Planctomycetota bacterium]